MIVCFFDCYFCCIEVVGVEEYERFVDWLWFVGEEEFIDFVFVFVW